MTIQEQLEYYLENTNYRHHGDEYIIYHKSEEIAPLHIKVKDQALFMYCQIAINSSKQKIIKTINQANAYTTYGSFDYRIETGELYYRCALDLTNRPFSLKQFKHLYQAPLADWPVLKKQL